MFWWDFLHLQTETFSSLLQMLMQSRLLCRQECVDPKPPLWRLLFCPFCSWLNGAWWMQTASSTPVPSISTWLLGSATTLWLMLPPKPTSGLTVLSGSMTKLTTCQKPGWEVSSPPLDLLDDGGSLHPVLPSSVMALIHWHQLGFKSINRTVYFF